jgi:L-threonylcarbamoyladenylate synthase
MRISLAKACQLLTTGHIVAVPTETVYGLAAPLSHPSSIDAIFTAKGRPTNNPLILHVPHQSTVAAYAQSFPKGFNELAEAFWPGPMTLILPIDPSKVPGNARANLPTAAFRVPNHPIALELLGEVGALVMPSANLSGSPSSTCPEHVEADFGIDFPVLDGGPCKQGLESTILIYQKSQWTIIRLGALESEVFTEVLGYTPEIAGIDNTGNPLCPGQLYRHYAPKTQLILVDHFTSNMQGIVLGFTDVVYPLSCTVLPLGPLSAPHIVAENLYATLRKLDDIEAKEAYVDMNFPRNALWTTIAERLKKASQRD